MGGWRCEGGWRGGYGHDDQPPYGCMTSVSTQYLPAHALIGSFQLGHLRAFSHRDPNKISLFGQKTSRLRSQQVTMDWPVFALGSHKRGPRWARYDTRLQGPPPDYPPRPYTPLWPQFYMLFGTNCLTALERWQTDWGGICEG